MTKILLFSLGCWGAKKAAACQSVRTCALIPSRFGCKTR
jgi:hypothetical protein